MASSLDTSIPTLVLKLYHHAGLGVVRTLGRLGVPVFALDPDRNSPGMHSRYSRKRFVFDIDKSSPEQTIHRLREIATEIGQRTFLIHTADETAVLLADHKEELRTHFIFPENNPGLIRSLVSKKELFFLAKQHCIPTAETLFPCSRADLVAMLGAIRFPVMLKGIDGIRLEQRTGYRMIIVQNRNELLERYDAMEDPSSPNLMIQEYIPGGPESIWMFNGYFDPRSECLVAYTGQKIRQAPIDTGYTSLGVCRSNADVIALTKSFMKAIGYQGILDIGYRYDARDGLYKVLDVNPRVGATFRLFATPNGMDVVRAAYLDLTGQRVVPSPPSEGRRWFVEDRDFASSIRYYRNGTMTVRDWLQSFQRVEESAWFAWDDLVPFFRMIARFITRGVRSFRHTRGAEL